MARKKKEEVKEVIIEKKAPEYGSGWTGKNNKIAAENREAKRK